MRLGKLKCKLRNANTFYGNKFETFLKFLHLQIKTYKLTFVTVFKGSKN